MAVRRDGRAAVTHWEVLEKYPGADGKPAASLLACRLETGRTHQIRVHLAHIGHPLIGDAVYGPGFRTKTARLSPAAAEAVRPLEDRPCMLICWLSNTRPRGQRWSSARNCPAISHVYITVSEPSLPRGRIWCEKSTPNQRFNGVPVVTPS